MELVRTGVPGIHSIVVAVANASMVVAEGAAKMIAIPFVGLAHLAKLLDRAQGRANRPFRRQRGSRCRRRTERLQPRVRLTA